MLKIQQIFPKLYRCLLYVIFQNLKPQNAGLVDVKKDYTFKKIKGNFCARKSKKISIVIKNLNGSEDPLMHNQRVLAIIFFNSFTHYQAEQIKKGIICVQIF